MVGTNIRIHKPNIPKKLEELLEHGTDSIDPHTTYHIKGDVIWASGPKAKHEIMRGQWGKELKDISLQELLKLFKKSFLPAGRAQYFTVEPNSSTLKKKRVKHWTSIGRN